MDSELPRYARARNDGGVIQLKLRRQWWLSGRSRAFESSDWKKLSASLPSAKWSMKRCQNFFQYFSSHSTTDFCQYLKSSSVVHPRFLPRAFRNAGSMNTSACIAMAICRGEIPSISGYRSTLG